MFTNKYGDIPVQIKTSGGKITLNLGILGLIKNSTSKQISNELDKIAEELESLEKYLPGDGGRGDHIVRERGLETITMITGARQQKFQNYQVELYVDTLKKLLESNTDPVDFDILQAPANIKQGAIFNHLPKEDRVVITDFQGNGLDINEVLTREIEWRYQKNRLQPAKVGMFTK